MGRRNAICLPGCNCSFSSAMSPSEAASGAATKVQELPPWEMLHHTQNGHISGVTYHLPHLSINNKINIRLSPKTIYIYTKQGVWVFGSYFFVLSYFLKL